MLSRQSQPLVSVIMPTLNADKVIGLSLAALHEQDYPSEKIEILVIDGGSKDKTLKIAKNYGASVLSNPLVQPEHAKLLGLKAAKGRYAMFLDSDEVLRNPGSIREKVRLLEDNRACKNIVTTGLISPGNFPFISNYINKYGDPFSYFIHRIDGGNYYDSMRKRFEVETETNKYEIIKFKKNDTIPIVDGGGHFFDLTYLKSIENIGNKQLSAIVFGAMCSRTHRLGVLKDDYVEHHSTSSIRTYLNKIRWRIVSNLSLAGKSIPGYKGREKFINKGHKLKKYLFIPYALLIIPAMIDSISLSAKHNDFRYIIHLPLSFYTAVEIIIQTIKIFIFGITTGVEPYGQT